MKPLISSWYYGVKHPRYFVTYFWLWKLLVLWSKAPQVFCVGVNIGRIMVLVLIKVRPTAQLLTGSAQQTFSLY